MSVVKPLVSVCIPCRNAERYVAAAVESVLAQSWPHVEVVIVDDGSTDSTADVLRGFERRGVKVIHERCGSASKARNRAYKESCGEYIKYFDADDLMNATCIERQVLRLSREANAVSTCGWGRFYNDDLASFRANPQSVWRDMPGTSWLVESLSGAQAMMQPGMFLIPRDLHERVGPWESELSPVDDFEFFSRVLCKADTALFANDAWLYYRSGLPGSLSKQRDYAAAEAALMSFTKGTSHLLHARSDVAAKEACADIFQNYIYTFYPEHADLLARAARRVAELGGSELAPPGPPRFQQLRKLVGWRLARRVQQWVRR